MLRAAPLVAFVVLLQAVPAAPQAALSRLAVDTAAAIDQSVDESGNGVTGVTFDAVGSLDLGAGFEAIVRPSAQRLSSGEWNRQIWVAALRYERKGPLGVRVDAGLIPSPVGLGNLLLRPHLNPTISLPSSLFAALPLDPRTPRTTLLGAVYAFGASATVSGEHWDARAALIDTSPLRTRRVFARSNPPRFANVVVGGGLTPFVGLRIGASVTHGGWQRAGESPLVVEDRTATIVAVESEFSVRHTAIAGEWVHDRLETAEGPRIASGWFVQGRQTLAPRWFAAGRVERIFAPALFPPLLPPVQLDLTGVESVVGYRITPAITVRVGHRARRLFGRPDFLHQAQASVVWWQRWM